MTRMTPLLAAVTIEHTYDTKAVPYLKKTKPTNQAMPAKYFPLLLNKRFFKQERTSIWEVYGQYQNTRMS